MAGNHPTAASADLVPGAEDPGAGCAAAGARFESGRIGRGTKIAGGAIQ
jgi:hypothetical protein